MEDKRYLYNKVLYIGRVAPDNNCQEYYNYTREVIVKSYVELILTQYTNNHVKYLPKPTKINILKIRITIHY